MLLKNCKIISPEGMATADILIEGEKIKKIGRNVRRAGLKGEDVINNPRTHRCPRPHAGF